MFFSYTYTLREIRNTGKRIHCPGNLILPQQFETRIQILNIYILFRKYKHY